MTCNTCILVIAACLISLGGCASYKPMPERGTQEYRDTLAVVAQICMPKTYTSDGLWVSEVYRYGRHGELRAYGGGKVSVIKVGMSSGHPVYERFFPRRQTDLMAIIANVNKTGYVYDPRPKVLSQEWSKWEPPLSQNPTQDMAGYRLANDQVLKTRQPDIEAPKIRYRLVRMSDRKAPRANDDLVDCETP